LKETLKYLRPECGTPPAEASSGSCPRHRHQVAALSGDEAQEDPHQESPDDRNKLKERKKTLINTCEKKEDGKTIFF
jgi:hypothetical protein